MKPPMKKLILLAEDQPDDELFFRRELREFGITNEIRTLRNARQVIAYLKGEGAYADRNLFPLPSVIFLDLVMPGGDGMEALRWLQNQPKNDNLLVVVLSNFSEKARMDEARNLGAHTCLLKPLHDSGLQAIVELFPDFWEFSAERQSWMTAEHIR